MDSPYDEILGSVTHNSLCCEFYCENESISHLDTVFCATRTIMVEMSTLKSLKPLLSTNMVNILVGSLRDVTDMNRKE